MDETVVSGTEGVEKGSDRRGVINSRRSNLFVVGDLWWSLPCRVMSAILHYCSHQD